MAIFDFSERRAKSGTFRWIGVVVLSAIVGSGATMAMVPVLEKHTGVGTAASATLPSVNGVTPMSTNVNVSVSDGITKVVKAAEPDVVAVVNYTSQTNSFNQQSQPQASDIGSGLLFDKDAKYAFIVTNNHVVEGGSQVQVVNEAGKKIQGSVVGTDPYTDLAVIRVPVSNFANVQPAQFANSSAIQVGEPAIAIGTPMGLDFADTVTSGIVSGKQRMMPVEEPTSQQTLDYQSVIQTDAAINPGNSGGPLLNIKGQVIGINSSKIVAPDFQGMGFAIPANEVKTITAEIIKTGHAVHPSLGIEGYSLDSIPDNFLPNVPVSYGVYVAGVTSAEAKSAGLKQGDVIVALNGKTIQSVADLRTDLFQTQPGQQANVTVYRNTQKVNLKITIGQENTVNTTADAQNGNGGNTGSGSGFGGITPDGQNPYVGP